MCGRAWSRRWRLVRSTSSTRTTAPRWRPGSSSRCAGTPRQSASAFDILAVRLLDVHAPATVHDAFRDVASAHEDRLTTIHQANEYAAGTRRGRARRGGAGDFEGASRIRRAARAASGNAKAFAALAAEHKRSPRLTEDAALPRGRGARAARRPQGRPRRTARPRDTSSGSAANGTPILFPPGGASLVGRRSAGGESAMKRRIAAVRSPRSSSRPSPRRFVVDTTEYAVVTRFGRPVRTYTTPGLRLPRPARRPGRPSRCPPAHDRAAGRGVPDARQEERGRAHLPHLAGRRSAALPADRATLREAAEARLAAVTSSEIGAAFGSVPFEALVSTDPEKMRLGTIVAAVEGRVRETAAREYGIDLVSLRRRAPRLPAAERGERLPAHAGRAPAHRQAVPLRGRGGIAQDPRRGRSRARAHPRGGRAQGRRDPRPGGGRGGAHLCRRARGRPGLLPLRPHARVVRQDHRQEHDRRPARRLAAHEGPRRRGPRRGSNR